jgi:hypothetical protein
VEYPLAFQEAFIKRRSQQQTPANFRYVHVSGKFVEQDPERKLYFLDAQRKTKVFPSLYFLHLIVFIVRVLTVGFQGIARHQGYRVS